MKLTVKLFGDLRRFLPQANRFKGCEVKVSSGAKLAEVLALLPVPPETAFMIIVNDQKINAEDAQLTTVSENDEIVLLPPIKGG